MSYFDKRKLLRITGIEHFDRFVPRRNSALQGQTIQHIISIQEIVDYFIKCDKNGRLLFRLDLSWGCAVLVSELDSK